MRVHISAKWSDVNITITTTTTRPTTSIKFFAKIDKCQYHGNEGQFWQN